MDDQFFSTKCPSCNQSLLGSSIFNPSFFFKAFCPFCGLLVRWARMPFLMVLLGVITIALSFHLPEQVLQNLAAQRIAEYAGIAFGTATFLYGILFLRFKAVSSPNLEEERPKYYYPI